MITGKLNLAALTHVKFKSDKGADCILIPIKENNLFFSEKGAVYIDIIAFDMKEPKDYATHIVKQSFSKEVRETMTESEKNNQPILGNLKTLSGISEASNDVGEGKIFDAESKDGLPF